MTLRYIGLISLLCAVLISWDFVLNYGFRANWKSHPYGRITLAFKTTITVVLTLTIINSFFMHYPGRDVLRLVMFNVFVACFFIQDVFLRKQLRRDRKSRDVD